MVVGKSGDVVMPDTMTEPDASKTALQAWIRLAVGPSEIVRRESSYVIKYDFVREGFFVTGDQFRGALLTAGYEPATKTDRFRMVPRSTATYRDGTYAGFSLQHLPAGERARYDRQVRKAVVEREEWRAAAATETIAQP